MQTAYDYFQIYCKVYLVTMAAEKRPSSLYFDLMSLRERFDEVDSDGKGFIDYEGLQTMIANMDEFDPGMARELMDSLDRDKDGKVTLEDFQTIYTVERDVIKEQEDTVITVSPNKPPISSNYRSQSRNNSKRLTTPSPSSLRNVPDSPDLASHARSLKGTVYEPSPGSETSHRLSNELGDVILEDTGEVPPQTTYDEPSPVTSPKPHSFYGDIKRELKTICPTGVVQREHIMKLSGTLGLDTIDEQELIGTWEDCESEMTVNSLCYLLQEKEKIALIATQPVARDTTQEGWQQSLGSPIILKDPPKSSTPYKQSAMDYDIVSQEETSDDEEDDDESGEWMSAVNYHFIDAHHQRPSSAREGSRLSRGYSETGSLRQTAMMQNEYRLLQGKLEQIISENDSLKANFARLEEEKKILILEGEESIQQFQRIKQDEMNAMKELYNTKLKEMEKAFTNEQQLIQERADHETTVLKEQILKMKNANKRLNEDTEFYQNDNQKLIEELQKMSSEIKEKENRIARLHETFGIQMESPSDTDLERQATKLQELEKDVNDYAQFSEDLRAQNRELQDNVDELSEECETLKMKIIEEKRKRQRSQRYSVSSLPSSTKSSSSHISLRPNKRILPPNATEETDGPSFETNNDIPLIKDHLENSGEESENFEAASSASLLEEMKIEENKQTQSKKIHDLEREIISLEESCKTLKEENDVLFQSNEKLNEEYNQLKTHQATLQFQFNKVIHEKEEITKEVEEMKIQVMSNEEMSQALKQENLELHSSLILSQNNGDLFEDKCDELVNEVQQLTTRIHSLEQELKRKNNETGLAIHDLTIKEEDCLVLQEKVETLEDELHQLRVNENHHVSQINKFHSQLELVNKEKSELETSLLEKQTLSQSPSLELSLSPVNNDEKSKIANDSFLLPPTSPFSLNHSFQSSSTTGRSEIVTQMKTQLEDLQRVLVQKGGQDITDEDMTVIQELLDMNTTLEENMAEQHRWFDTEINHRDEQIENYRQQVEYIRSSLTEMCDKMMSKITQNLQMTIEDMSQRVSSLLIKVQSIEKKFEEREMTSEDKLIKKQLQTSLESVKSLQDSLEMTEHDLEESEKKRMKLEEILTRQRNELELVNHYLGKAKSLELQYDREKEEKEKQLKEKDKVLHSNSIEILELRERVKSINEDRVNSMPNIHLITENHETVEEPITCHSMEDLAEEDIDLLRSGLQQTVGVSLVQEVRGELKRMEKERKTHRRSTESAEDLIILMRNEVTKLYQDIVNATASATLVPDYKIMIDRIRKTVNNLKTELSSERELLMEAKNKLVLKSQEYDQLYVEHEEEIKSMEQQNKQTEVRLIHSFTAKDKETYEELEELKETKERLHETNALLENELHKSLTSLNMLKTERNILIDTIQTLSLQTIHTLNFIQ